MFNPMFIEDEAHLSMGDWIALRRLVEMQSLTDAQVERLVQLGLAERTLKGVVCSREGRETLQTRP